MKTMTSRIAVGLLYIAMGGAFITRTARAQEELSIAKSQAVRAERSFSITGGATYGYVLDAPMPEIRFGWNLSSYVEFEARIASLYYLANRASLGTRVFFMQTMISPYAYARAGVYNWFTDQNDVVPFDFIMEGGGGVELALRGGFVAFLEGGVVLHVGSEGAGAIPMVSAGLGYRF